MFGDMSFNQFVMDDGTINMDLLLLVKMMI